MTTPARAVRTRFCPSPTGMVHVGLMLRPPAPLAEGEGVAL